MKSHIVVPVMFRTFRDEETGWFGKELIVESLSYTKNKDFLKGLFGSTAIEVLLDAGWSIISVQSATNPGGDSPGSATFVYVLESPEIN